MENQAQVQDVQAPVVQAPVFKAQYNEVERKAIKNLSTSISILKADIRSLEAVNTAEGTTAEVIAANEAKIVYKLDRITEKTNKMADIKAGVELVEVAPKAPRIAKPKKVKDVDHTVNVDSNEMGTPTVEAELPAAE